MNVKKPSKKEKVEIKAQQIESSVALPPLNICPDRYLTYFELDPNMLAIIQINSSKTLSDLKKQLNEEISYRDEFFLKKPTVLKSRLREKEVVIKFVYKFNDTLKQFEKSIEQCHKKIQIASVEEKPKYSMILKELEGKKRELEEILRNEKNIASMRHKNCLRINWFGDFINHFVYISELCFYGNLASFQWRNLLFVNEAIKNLNWLKYMSEILLSHFTMGVLSANEFFKNVKIVHGNLSLDNILLSHNFSVKVTDFSCSKSFINLDTFKLVNYTSEINKEYQPPEFFRSDSFVDSRDAHKIDIFAFGCGLFYLATEEVLFEENSKKNPCDRNINYIDNIIQKIKVLKDLLSDRRKLERSEEFCKFLTRMLEPFEKGRININELLNHSWLTTQTKFKREKVQNLFYGEKMIIEMMKIQYVNEFSENNKFQNHNNKYFHITNLETRNNSNNGSIKIKNKKLKYDYRNKKYF